MKNIFCTINIFMVHTDSLVFWTKLDMLP